MASFREHVFVKHDGKVGVGNSNPTHDLDVVGSLNVTSKITCELLEVGGSLFSGGSNGVVSLANVPQGGTGSTSFEAGKLIIGNGIEALSSADGLYYDSINGNFGIGKTPDNVYKLDVDGSVNISCNATFHGLLSGLTANIIYLNTLAQGNFATPSIVVKILSSPTNV